MKLRSLGHRVWLAWLLPVTFVPLGAAPAGEPAPDNGKDKPSIDVKVSPGTGFAPMRAVITAELKGGDDDYEDFYCPTIEWDITVTEIQSNFDSGVPRLSDARPVQKSEQKLDCDPYEPGKSEIKRRFVREHTFSTGGEYTIKFSLKQNNKTVGSDRVTVRVRGGVMGLDGVQ